MRVKNIYKFSKTFIRPIKKKISRVFLKKTGSKDEISLCMILNFIERTNYPILNINKAYTLKVYQVGDEYDWVHFLNKSGEFKSWNETKLKKEILDYLLPDGGFLIYYQGNIIGCSAVCQIPKFKPFAVLMYVLVDKEHRNLGIGKSLTILAIEEAKKNCFPGIILHTRGFRREAIFTYLKLGFKPDYRGSKDEEKYWQKLLKNKNFKKHSQ